MQSGLRGNFKNVNEEAWCTALSWEFFCRLGLCRKQPRQGVRCEGGLGGVGGPVKERSFEYRGQGALRLG